MSLNTAVSGINAAQSALNVTSNDLANVNTTGFKSGTQRFADIYPAGGNNNTAGIGVRTNGIERSFQQGNTQTTNNPLDLAIQGKGFFAVSHNGTQQYTRDGHFHIDAQTNQLVNAEGDKVLGYPGGAKGGATISPLTLTSGAQPATPTSKQSMQLNLNQADSAIASSVAFSSSNSNSYNESTSVTAYDSLGNPNQVQLYFRKQAGTGSGSTPDSWKVYAQPVNSAGNKVGSAASLTTMQFNSSGALTAGSSGSITVPWGSGSGVSAGAGSTTINFKFGGTTLANQNFAVNSATGNGYPPGKFQGVKIGKSGTIQAQYSNGKQSNVGQIALATFANDQGLAPVSNNKFTATTTSGKPTINAVGQGQAGQVQSGQLEQSNVNLSNKLVSLITDQQAYQANTKSIGTDKQDVRSLLQI